MSKVLIHPDILGGEVFFLLDTTSKKGKFIDHFVDVEWHLSKSDKDLIYNLYDLFAILKQEEKLNIPLKYKNQLSQLILVSDDLPIRWDLVMSRQDYKNHVLTIISEVMGIFTHPAFVYLLGHFCCVKKALSKLSPLSVNKVRLQELIKEAELNFTHQKVNSLKAFQPDFFGNTKKLKYSFTKSQAGQMVVEEGPNILNLDKEYRNILTSSFGKDGKLIYMDYKSLQPRVARILAGYEAQEDVYQDVVENLNLQEYPRENIKKVVMGILFGAKTESVSQWLNISKELASKITFQLYEYFGIIERKEKLRKELEEKKYITTHWGRPIVMTPNEEYKAFIYYIQGSATDFAMHGFSNIIETISNDNIRGGVVALIHDALILNIHKDYEYYINNLIKIGVKINGFKQQFYIKTTELK